MDGDDSEKWVLVNDVDSADEAETLISLTPVDSDQESDGSISIIKDHFSDSYSDEDFELTKDITREDESVTRRVEDVPETSETEDASYETYDSNFQAEFNNYMNIGDQAESVNNYCQSDSVNDSYLNKQDQAKLDLAKKDYEDCTIPFLKFLVCVGTVFGVMALTIYQAAEDSLTETYPILDKDTIAIIDLCIYEQFLNGRQRGVEKCAFKKLEKLQMKDITQRSQAYFEMKKRLKELQDQGLFREDVAFQDMPYPPEKKCKKLDPKKVWDTHAKKQKKGDFNSKIDFNGKKQMKAIKKKIKSLCEKEKFCKKFNKFDPNEDWYLKYNPSKDTIEVINITNLPKEHSSRIKKKAKVVNGDWYMKLYGSSRADSRTKEQAQAQQSQWYFQRSRHRSNQRDTARWYFDYMYGREDTRDV